MHWSLWLGTVVVVVLVVLFLRRRDQLLRAQVRALGEYRPLYDKNQITGLSIPVHTKLQFLLLREDEATRRMRSRGELVEPQTGVHVFDWRFFLESDGPELAPWLAGDEQARELIEHLIGDDRSLQMEDGELTLKGLRGVTETPVLNHLGKRLTELASRLPRLTQSHPDAAATARLVAELRWLFNGALLAALALGLYSFLGPSFPQNASSWPLWLVGAIVGALPARSAYRWALRRARHSARARSIRKEARVGLVLPLIVLSTLIVPQINLWVPGSTVHEAEATITGTSKTRKGRPHIHITTQGDLPNQLALLLRLLSPGPDRSAGTHPLASGDLRDTGPAG